MPEHKDSATPACAQGLVRILQLQHRACPASLHLLPPYRRILATATGCSSSGPQPGEGGPLAVLPGGTFTALRSSAQQSVDGSCCKFYLEPSNAPGPWQLLGRLPPPPPSNVQRLKSHDGSGGW